MEAEVNLAQAQVEPGDQVPRLKLELQDVISAETVNPIIDVLKKAVEGDLIEIHLRHNGGGNVDRMVALIDALSTTAARVEITFSRYVMSAAATIWLWFFMRETPRVKSLLPIKKGVVMYHRPRRQRSGYLCFCDEMAAEHPLRGPLQEKMRMFDELFEEVFLLLSYLAADQEQQEALQAELHDVEDQLLYKHSLFRMREAYYGNQDCLIPV